MSLALSNPEQGDVPLRPTGLHDPAARPATEDLRSFWDDHAQGTVSRLVLSLMPDVPAGLSGACHALNTVVSAGHPSQLMA